MGTWQISTDGGAKPLWSRDGNELFYVSYGLGGRIAAVGIQTTAGFLAGPIVTAVPTPYYNFQPHRTFDVSLDGNRFLVLKDIASNPPPSAAPTSVVLVMHWTDAFKAKPNTQ